MRKLNDIEQTNVVGGMGYSWKCKTCGYQSAWHMFKETAQSNAYEHEKKYSNHKTKIISE